MLPLVVNDELSVLSRTEETVMLANHHYQHTMSCNKGLAARTACRFAYGQPINNDGTGPVELQLLPSQQNQKN